MIRVATLYPRERAGTGRAGLTLIELLVVMAIIAALLGLVMLIAPGALNSDRTLAATAQVQSTLKVAQAMSAAGTPRGVRFIAPYNPQAGRELQVIELQLIEMRPVIVPNPRPLSDPSKLPKAEPHVQFDYALTAPPGPAGGPPRGIVTDRRLVLHNLTADEMSAVWEGGSLVLPVLGFWTKFKKTPAANQAGAWGQEDASKGYDGSRYWVALTWQIEVYPDSVLGAAGGPHNGALTPVYLTHHFGIYSPPVPLLGEPTIPLPSDSCVDLEVSLPAGKIGENYDVLFAPSGQLLDSPSGYVFLWVRDGSKMLKMAPGNLGTAAAPYQWQFDATQVRQGGEQWIVGIRGRSGALGTAPWQQPDVVPVSGPATYTQPAPASGLPVQDPFTFARKQLQ